MNAQQMPSPTALGLRIAAMIRATGPMNLSEYMHVCLNDSVHGYYRHQQAIGRTGDFITSPEISQMFGELIGVWCTAIWQAMGSPGKFVLAEAGPGRGTLMADLLRACARFPGFLDAARIRLIETSPAMILEQKSRLAGLARECEWHAALDHVDELPLILVANEFLDVLPIRQFIKTATGWREHCIGTCADGSLEWVVGTTLLGSSQLPANAHERTEGSIFEIAPAREAWTQNLTERLVANGGAALFIDYGHAHTRFGGTFQALRNHRPVDPLAGPGLCDLTAHVDFSAIGSVAAAAGAQTSPVISQGTFLQAMGLAERAGAMGAGKSAQMRADIRLQAERLVMPDKMGELFKVLALASPEFAPALALIPPFCLRNGN